MVAEFCAKSEYGHAMNPSKIICRAHCSSHNGVDITFNGGGRGRGMMIPTKMLFILLMKIMLAVMYQLGWPRTPEL